VFSLSGTFEFLPSQAGAWEGGKNQIAILAK